MIFPGIYASQISGHLFTLTGSYDALASVTVPSGGLSSVTFAGIPTGYSHLQIRGINGQTYSTTKEILISFNGDNGTNYTTHQLYGNGSSAGAYSNTGITQTYVGQSVGTANYFGATVIDILDYANTNKNKTARMLWGWDANGSGQIFLSSGLWLNTSAITSITLAQNSGNMAQYSSFALYGVK
jgi:hypothetical protein